MPRPRRPAARTSARTRVLTPSLAALQLLREGGALQAGFQPGQAIPFYREALTLDPEFSEAYALMAGAFNNIGEQDSALASVRRALEHPERLPDLVPFGQSPSAPGMVWQQLLVRPRR